RLRTFRVLCGVVLLIATLALVGGTPASATTYCQYQPYEKDTALVGFQTYIETRQQGNFFTSGSSNCWGQGTYAHTELTSSGTSYCYGHITPLIFSVHISSCAYILSGTSWYYDGYKERYKSFTWKLDGHYVWSDTTSGVLTDAYQHDQFNITYSGTYTFTMSNSGHWEGGTYFHYQTGLTCISCV